MVLTLTIISDYGECEIAVPRDTNGEFEPKVIEKRQTRTDEIEQKILQMYAKGMSQRDIEDVLKQIYGAEITQGFCSCVSSSSIRAIKRPFATDKHLLSCSANELHSFPSIRITLLSLSA